jgi:hypothetical protein
LISSESNKGHSLIQGLGDGEFNGGLPSRKCASMTEKYASTPSPERSLFVATRVGDD